MAITKLNNLVDPQVLATMISAQLPNAIRLAPLAEVDNTLVGQPGSTLTVPSWDYIGEAEDVAEGAAIPIAQLGKKTKDMTIKKAGKGVEITDEAVLSGYGDPVGEAASQLVKSIADKVDTDLVTALATSTQTYTANGGMIVANLDSALAIFDDEDDTEVVLIARPEDAAVLRADGNKNWLSGTELGANRIVSGVFGEILGTQVVRSRRIKKGEAYLVKKGALKLLLKRDILVEDDRNIINKTTTITTDKHYGTYLYDATKTVKIKISGSPTPTP